jgi:GntR family transcriptional repressor for pyruvate dehydrogenase complex
MLQEPLLKTDIPYQRIGGQRETLSQQFAEQILDLIASRNLHPGDMLPSQQELCEKFGVSRTVVREGLQLLAGLGVVRISQGVRAQIIKTDPSAISAMLRISAGGGAKGMDNLLTVREILEPEIAARAARLATAEHIARMQAAIDLMQQTLDDPEQYIIHDNAFHIALAKATANDLLMDIISPIVSLLQEMRRVSVTVEGASERAQSYHRAILQQVVARDPDGARRKMQEHLAQVRGELTAAHEVLEGDELPVRSRAR